MKIALLFKNGANTNVSYDVWKTKRNSDLSAHLCNYAIKFMKAHVYLKASSVNGIQTRKGAKYDTRIREQRKSVPTP